MPSIKESDGEGRGVLIQEEHLFVILALGMGSYSIWGRQNLQLLSLTTR